MQNTPEDRIRESIKLNEQQLFNNRIEIIKYLIVYDGRMLPDPRYADKIAELQAQEGALTRRITGLEGALAQAASIGGQYSGCNRTNPFSWLTDRAKQLTKGIGILETDIEMLKKQIEENAGVGTRPNMITRLGQFKAAPDATQSWRDQMTEKENQIEELKLQVEQIRKLISEIEPILKVI